jgi:UDP-N-acetyl-2-amino-2-deoxyglucuronate dehydrogenase
VKNFALIGAGGYIASRHLSAIRDTDNVLVAALDVNDSVGILDSYFPDCSFFTEFEIFDRHIEKLRLEADTKIDYISICSPNYLHDSHARFGLRIGADVICEKPLVINPWNIDALQKIEKESKGVINTILQLRLHPSIIKLKQQVDKSSKKIFNVDLTYMTSRGKWYDASWKGNLEKSGGVATNIGVHFFDMLTWVFGKVEENIVHIHDKRRAAGHLVLEKANVRWFLSLEKRDIPNNVDKSTYRSIKVNGEEIEFSDGFTDLHTLSYKDILNGNGNRLETVRPSIQVVSDIRNANPIGIKGDYHPILLNLKKKEI